VISVLLTVLTATGACATGEFVSTLNPDGPPTCALQSSIQATAATANALTVNGGNCSGNNFAIGVDAMGVSECSQPAFSNLSGSATDAQLASNYSGVGACATNQWASTLNDNAAPTCSQPAFSNLSGSATDAQVPDSITVTLAATATALAANGANCSGNNFALGVDSSGAGECAQPAFSNLSGTVTDAQLASNYSGTGSCAAGNFVSAVNDNAAPTCTLTQVTASINTSDVGNVGASGPDDLIAYTLPANTLSANNKGVRWRCTGTTANNANTKTVALVWGTQTVVSKILTASVAGNWSLEGACYRTGSNTQDCYGTATNANGTAVSATDGATILFRSARLAGTQTDSATIAVKCQSTTSTANNDILQDVLAVDVIN
jgi:hypothetical protein